MRPNSVTPVLASIRSLRHRAVAYIFPPLLPSPPSSGKGRARYAFSSAETHGKQSPLGRPASCTGTVVPHCYIRFRILLIMKTKWKQEKKTQHNEHKQWEPMAAQTLTSSKTTHQKQGDTNSNLPYSSAKTNHIIFIRAYLRKKQNSHRKPSPTR